MEKRFQGIVRFMEEEIPFNQHLGIKIEALREGFTRMFLPFRTAFIGDKRRPALHGGLISTLIDTCGGAAAWTYVTKDDRISTVDLRVDYLNPAPGDDIVAESIVQRMGNRVCVVNTQVFAAGDNETIIAEGRSVYNIRRVDP